MSGVLIIKPEPIAALQASAGSGAANLATYAPKEVWVATDTAIHWIDIDLGKVSTVDSFCLAYTNATADAVWAIHTISRVGDTQQSVAQSGWLTMRAGDSLGPRHHAFVRLPAPVTARYFRFIIDQGGATPIYVGALVIGRAFEKFRERGEDRTLVDTGTRNDLPDGGFNMGDGVVKAQFSFSFVDLTDVERNQLYAIKRDRGLRKPVVVVEDADLSEGRNEAIHYGVFDRFQPYERVNPRKSRWAGSVLEWA